MISVDDNIERARQAFTAQAPHFDEYDRANVILQWMRRQVYKHEADILRQGDAILELNAGTGIDALHFAGIGHQVFATDVSEGMLAELSRKVAAAGMEGRIRYAKCSFTTLHQLRAGPFDHVFSNFGGLNCIPDLRPVAEQLVPHLNPGATLTLVIMPRVCLWELVQVLRGRPRFAFRRFHRNGTPSKVEGHEFLSFYFSPSEVAESFGPKFDVITVRGLASLVPPPSSASWAERHPATFRFLTSLEETLASRLPFNRWADHFIITLKYSR